MNALDSPNPLLWWDYSAQQSLSAREEEFEAGSSDVRACSKLSVLVSKCPAEEGCHRVPPRGVRSRLASS